MTEGEKHIINFISAQEPKLKRFSKRIAKTLSEDRESKIKGIRKHNAPLITPLFN